MSELIVTIGPSGSGKSTAIRKIFPNHIVLSPDNLREEISYDYSISGPRHKFNYGETFGTKISDLKKTNIELYEKIIEIIPAKEIDENSNLDANIFKYVMNELYELLISGHNIVFDATTLSSARWEPLIKIARKANAVVKALWLTDDEFSNKEEYLEQILKNNEERHSLDVGTGKPRGRYTPKLVLEQMTESALKLKENPPPIQNKSDNKIGFDEVIKYPVKKRDILANKTSWLKFAKNEFII
jgi:predicted kinase